MLRTKFHFTNDSHSHSPLCVLKTVMYIVAGLSLAVLFGLAFGFAVQYLWNVVVVSIFSIRAITYWEAVGIIILCKLLFGGHHPHPHNHKRRDRGEHEHFHTLVKERRDMFSSYWESEGKEAFKAYCEKKPDQQ